jgi:hypothetical protein
MLGLVRDNEGVLVWHGGRHYADPGEAVKRFCAGKQILTCAERVYREYSSSPCECSAKHDPDANGRFTRCGKHSAAAKAKRKATEQARLEATRMKWKLQDDLSKANGMIEPALRQIAEGHNDPRTLAQEVLAAVDAAQAAFKGDQA